MADPVSRITPRLNVISLGVFILSIALAVFAGVRTKGAAAPIVIMLVGVVAMQSPKIAQQWERGVVLRLGRFIGLRGPGLFWVVPFMDSVSSWIDQRTITTNFAAEQTLIDHKRAGQKLTRGMRKERLDAHAAALFLQEFLDGKLHPIEVT
jgi:hypothetical protein